MTHSCIPSTWEAEAKELQVWCQPGLSSKTITQKKKKRIYFLFIDCMSGLLHFLARFLLPFKKNNNSFTNSSHMVLLCHMFLDF
jgi:hypothetical protein